MPKNILDDIGGNKIMSTKDTYLVKRNIDNEIEQIEKIEYFSEREELKIKSDIHIKEMQKEKEKAQRQEIEIAIKEQKEKEENETKRKERILKAFDYFCRDFKEDLLEYTYDEYEEVVKWYREYINNNKINVIHYLDKYL